MRLQKANVIINFVAVDVFIFNLPHSYLYLKLNDQKAFVNSSLFVIFFKSTHDQ